MKDPWNGKNPFNVSLGSDSESDLNDMVGGEVTHIDTEKLGLGEVIHVQVTKGDTVYRLEVGDVKKGEVQEQ